MNKVLAILSMGFLCCCCGNGASSENNYEGVIDSVVVEPVNCPLTLEDTVYINDGTQTYHGEGTEIEGFFCDKSIGIIGHLSGNGILTLELPEVLEDSLLTEQPTETTHGGTLTLKPDIRLAKTAEDYMLLFYITKGWDKKSEKYPAGWSFVTNQTRTYQEKTEGYRWTWTE